MSTSSPKLVDNPHYHLWTDTLHIRKLAHQAQNKWDRGTYVRLTYINAWTVLEIACQLALEDSNISYSFKKNLDNAIKNKSLPQLDWSQGIWQRVSEVQEVRKGYVHRFISETNLFPEATLADNAIEVIREAIQAIYNHVRKTPPEWVEDNEDRGWHNAPGISPGIGIPTLYSKNADENDPNAVKITIIREGIEDKQYLEPPGTDPEPFIKRILDNPVSPISAIRVYRGDKLIEERTIPMRGS